MQIQWEVFTPIHSFFGGTLIGLATVLLLFFKGRIAGISGILGALMQSHHTPADHYQWRAFFIMGLLLSSFIYSIFAVLPRFTIQANWLMLILAGLLVGFGTRMGSGCTSGHGICGLSRLSTRSFVATLIFMSAGVIACFIFLHLIGI
jgi:uncharacterized membrane protein YedE/YeeE